MPTLSLEQALEGVQFPCDRSRLVEYALHNQLGARTLETLQAIPDRQYSDLSELFSALPARPMAIGAEDENVPLVTPVDAAMQLWLCSMQTWPEWIRLSQRLWLPWLK